MNYIDWFKGNCDIRVWLCQIAKNSYFSYLRKNKYLVHLDSIAVNIDEFDMETDNCACVTFHRARNKIKKKMRDYDENNV